jgi:hypothetical protein
MILLSWILLQISCSSGIQTFLWKSSKGKLLTNDEKKHRGMTYSDLCPRCTQATETIMHVLRDCDVVKDLWDNFITMDDDNWSAFFSLGLSEWLNFNLQLSFTNTDHWHWPTRFGIMANLLWKDINQFVISGNSLDPRQFLSNIQRYHHFVHYHLFLQ